MKTVPSRFFQFPATKLGRWSAGLMIVFIVVLALKMASLFPLPSMLIMAFGIVMTILMFVSVFWKGERSWLIMLLLIPGIFIIFFSIGEILYPH